LTEATQWLQVMPETVNVAVADMVFSSRVMGGRPGLGPSDWCRRRDGVGGVMAWAV